MTPHMSFSPNGVYHPLTLLMGYKPGVITDEKSAYSGYSSLFFGSMVSNTVVVAIPFGDAKVWVHNLRHLVSNFVNADNILAETELLELDPARSDSGTIARQVKEAFDAYPSAARIMLIWPYQMVCAKQPIMATGNIHFTYTHHNLNVQRRFVPECIVLAPEDKDAESEMVCKSVVAHADVDDILKAMYTRVLSTCEIHREEFMAYVGTTDYPNMQPFLQKTLVGKRGALMNHKDYLWL